MFINKNKQFASEINQINPEANMLLEKWRNELNAVDKVFNKELDYMRKISTAVLLESTTRHLNSVTNISEAGTQLGDVGFFKKYAINLIAAAIPNLIAPDIVSMQPMLSRVGEVRYLKVLYGSDKGNIKSGDTMFSAFHGGHGQTEYSSDAIDNEIVDLNLDIAQTKATGSLAWIPIIPRKVKIVINDTIEVEDDGTGQLIGTGITGNIDYNTGAFEIDSTTPFVTPSTAVVNYLYDNINAPIAAPEVNFKIASTPIVARSRKLKATYSLDASYDLTQNYGMQINNEIVSYTSAQIKHEIDGEIMNDLLKVASATTTSWDATPMAGISLREHNESFNNKITEASNNIFEATKLASGSFLVVGMNAANIVETLPRFTPAGIVKPVGPHLVGHLGAMPVYKNPYYPADSYLVGWKGSGLFDSGYLYCPYMPIMSTQLIMDASFQGQRGFATAYGKKTVNGNMYSRGIITNS